MPNRTNPIAGIKQKRTIDFKVRAVDEKSRRVTVSFSSEQSVSRWYGAEILAHDEGCVSLERLSEIGVALFNHDRSYVLGKVENPSLDSTEKRCYADIVFDDDPDADKIYQKVKSGTLKGVSVGYSVDIWEEVISNKTSTNGRFQGPCYIATRWTPYEISIVSVPADETVGVGREAGDNEEAPVNNDRADNTNTNNEEDERNMPVLGTQQKTAAEIMAEREEILKAERQRVSEITTLCREFNIDPSTHVSSGATMDDVRAAVLEEVRKKNTPISAGSVEVVKEERDKIREAASDAILMRSGIEIKKPAEGARDLRGMRLRDLAIDCLVRSGKANVHRLSDDELFRAALTPDGAFASILSNAVNKSMATGYQAANTTYQAWTGRGSNPDFKAATVYQISEAGDLEKMTQSGEFKFDEMKDNGVNKAVATFGRSFGMTRQALINDDLGVLTKIPQAYVRAAGRGINKLVYSMLTSNPNIYDGKALFHADHGNLGTAGAIGETTITELKKLMRKQKNLRGKETLNIAPGFLLVPAGLEVPAQKFLNSTTLPGETNEGVVNVFRNSMNLIVDAELDPAAGALPYYTAANPSDVDTIEVTYLNGDDMPKLESQVGFDFLGIKWRIYIDYGVTVLDYRGLGKNAGV